MDLERLANLAERVTSYCGMPRLAERMAATSEGGPTAEAAMSHARCALDRVAKVNNSIRMDKRTIRKPIAHYICNGGDAILRSIVGGALPHGDAILRSIVGGTSSVYLFSNLPPAGTGSYRAASKLTTGKR